MPTKLRTTLAAALAVVLMPALAQPAWAAVPSNDEPAGATVATKGVVYTQDTTGATTSAIDAQLNLGCGAPATEASVWYRYTPTADGPILADATGSTFDVGVMIVQGDPAAGGVVVGCGPVMKAAQALAGTTYYVMAFDAAPGGTNGGALSLTIGDAPPAPTISMTIDPRGTAFKDGSALVSGTYTCDGQPQGTMIDGTLTQKVGRVKISGYISVGDLICDGTPHAWSAYVYSTNGIFAGGKAASVSVAIACGAVGCGEGWVEQTIQLSRAKQK